MLSSTLHILLVVLVLLASIFILGRSQDDLESMSLYDFVARDIHGREVSLQDYASAKAILIGKRELAMYTMANCIMCNECKYAINAILRITACMHMCNFKIL